MRRLALFGSIALLSGCTGVSTFLDHAFSFPGTNPNAPAADSENVRKALGDTPTFRPLLPEPGNVWPGPQAPDPTLTDLQREQNNEGQRGFPATDVPGATPGLPAGRQPRPVGSSTPPGAVPPVQAGQPGVPAIPPPPRSTTPGPGPIGGVVNTPRGPAVDAGGTSSYRQLTTPGGPGAIIVPNGNGTSTVISPDGGVQTIPTPR